jgi:MFS family permease
MGGLMSPRLATFLVFVVNGVAVGTWIALIPGIKDTLGLSGTDLGIVLLVMNAGALVAQQITGQLLMRMPSERLLVLTLLVYPWLVILPLLAPSWLTLAAVMALFGFLNTTVDVVMNAHGVALEARDGRSIMSGLHAGWSLGGVIGAVAVALALRFGLEPLVEVALVASLLWVLAMVAGRFLGHGSARIEGTSGFHAPTRAVLPLVVLIVLLAFVEGGLSDWGGVYLAEGLGAPDQVAAYAFAALSAGLFLGRIGGDWVKDRIGSVRLIQLGMFLAAAAIAAFLLIGTVAVALVGMAVAGLGIANTVPQVFGAAGRIPPHGPSLSAVFTSLTLTFLIAPTVIGVTTDTASISVALALLVLASVVVALMVPRFPAAETNPRFRRAAMSPGS